MIKNEILLVTRTYHHPWCDIGNIRRYARGQQRYLETIL